MAVGNVHGHRLARRLLLAQLEGRPVDSVVVREASLDELERVIAVEVLAFAVDPPMRFIFPDPQAYLAHFPALLEAFGGGFTWASALVKY